MIENNLKLNKNSSLIVNNEKQNKKSINYTLVEINKKIYAIETKNVLEIIKLVELDYPNKMPSYIMGLIEYDKEPIGVFDLREIFKQERITYDLSSKIVIVKSENETISIICDKIIDIKKLNTDKIRPIPYQQEINFYKGIFIEEDANIYILNIDNILEYTKNNPEKFFNNSSTQKYIIDDEKSKEILKERKNFLSKVEQDVQNNVPLYDMGVSFIINNIKYYINMASVREFFKVNNSKFIKIPCTPDYIFGLINIKSEYITVLDIRRFFNNTKTEIKEKSTIIILNSNEFKIGILADEICVSMNIDFDEIIQNKLQKQEENKMLEFVKDGEIYQILDIDKLLKDEKLTIC